MRAIVLVGGEGTRLRPLTTTTPKPLLPVGNRPILERQLEWLARSGVDEAVLALGYLADPFVEHFPENRHEGVRLRYAVEEQPLGTAGAVRFAASVAGIRERFVVCNGDVLTTLDIGALVAWHAHRGARATIALTEVLDPSAFGVVRHAPDGEVEAFVEKPAVEEHTPSGRSSAWVNAGIYVLEADVLDRIPSGAMVSIERETFPAMSSGLYAMRSDAYWVDVGTPAAYLEANAAVLDGRLGMVPGVRQVAPGVWAQGELHEQGGLDEEVQIDGRVHAPALLGAGAALGVGASVRASVLGLGASVGPAAVVERAVLHDGARLDADARVADSIVGAGAVVGAGASVLDGSVIGAGVTVPAGTVVAAGRLP